MCVEQNTSNLLSDIAPPLSCTTNHPPFGLFFNAGIYIIVPNGYPFPAATVYQAVAFAPDAVIPFDFPQHFVQAQYAEAFNVLTTGFFPSTFLANAFDKSISTGVLVTSPLDVVITCALTCTILSIGSSIMFSSITVLSISISFHSMMPRRIRGL